MSPKKRFDYLQEPTSASSAETSGEPSSNTASNRGEARLTSVPRREGRMVQDREQLNVRIPTLLKRRAAAKAALDGETIGDVVEQLLLVYIGEESAE